MGHVDGQVSRGRNCGGPKSNLRDSTILIVQLGSKIDLLCEGVLGSGVGRNVLIRACTATKL